MNILHVTAGLDPKSGGPTRSVKGLCRALALSGCDVTLLVLGGNHPFDNPCGVKVRYGTLPSLNVFDLVHLHGLWDPKLHQVAVACRRSRVPYVISPRGMLDPWALSVKKWKKRLAMFLYQRGDLKRAAAFHVTAGAEAEHIRDQQLKQPIIIAPNGVELPSVLPEKTWGDPVFPHTAIFLSRLHPGKGLMTLAEAWKTVNPIGWRMLVVGPDSYGHKAEVVAKLKQLGIAGSWQFHDMVTDAEKWQFYRSADLLVHPSVSENFGITIAEGLAAELPVICTKGTPWRLVEERQCGRWIEQGVKPLERALRELTTCSDEERLRMGRPGRRLIEERFTWQAVCANMIRGYKEVLNGRA